MIEAEQCERDGTWERNDRLTGVAKRARPQAHVHALDDLQPRMLAEIKAFFGHYNQLAGRDFRVLRGGNSELALALIQ